MITIEISNPKIEKKFTKQEIEKIVNDYLEELEESEKNRLFEEFIFDAVNSDKHFKETNLHTTQDEMKTWALSLNLNSKSKIPACHK